MGAGIAVLALALLGLGALWLAIEVGLRVALARPLARGFYGSIGRDEVRALQVRHGVRAAQGPGWAHLAWIADPERERYVVERRLGASWRRVARCRYGSLLVGPGGGGVHRVRALPRRRRDGPPRLVGEADARPLPGRAPLFAPRRAGPWLPLFRPARAGSYVNDHCLFRDRAGRWRLLGITAHGDGDYDAERRLCHGVGETLPPAPGRSWREDEPVADTGDLAWAPHVVRDGDAWHLFWSPHRLHHMHSDDGKRWRDPCVLMETPRHRFFRDASVLEVAPGQWLLYATGRGRFFSRVDLYQSFDLVHWQYARAALRCGPGSERNAAFASTESPLVTRYRDRHYLSLTYDNGTWFWHALALWRRRPCPARYNDTLVLHAASPYDFGVYRGRRRTPALVSRLEAHAPRLVHDPDRDAWWLTTAGWPWAASLTRGEVAVAPLAWEARDPAAGD